MKAIYRTFLQNPLLTGSFVMIIGSTLANVVNYLYHLLIGRLLGPSSYGELVSLISISGIIGIIPSSVGLVIVKYISQSTDKNAKESLISWLSIKTFQLSSIICIILLLISPLIQQFLHISNFINVIGILLTGLFSLPTFYNRAILQGLLMFKQHILSILSENLAKLFISIILVYIGFNVLGGVLGLLISTILGWFLTYKYLHKFITKKPKYPKVINSMFTDMLPIAVQSISLTLLFTSDLILVKHFFSSYNAGMYGALSIMGKIIFFSLSPIGVVMFPLVAKKASIKNNDERVILYSFLATLFCAMMILMFYWFFPELAIRLLYGEAFITASNLLIWFGLFMSLYTLCSLLINYHLALGRNRVVFLPLIIALLQILGIWFYHQNLLNVIMISVSLTALLLACLLLYSSYEKVKKRNNLNILNSPSI